MPRDQALPLEREQPVAVDADDERAGGHARQSIRHTATASADIVRVHRLHESDIAVGVEPAGELVAVEVEVGLDGEPSAVTERSDLTLPGALEAGVQLGGAPGVSP